MNKIKEKRIEAGYKTQAELAQEIWGNSDMQHRISEWERGIKQPSGENMIKLSDALDCTPRELYPGV